MSDRIFSIVSPADVANNSFRLEENESHHIHRVLRRTVGDEIWLIDGLGSAYRGKITHLFPTVRGKIEETFTNFGENHRPVHVGMAVLKRTALEKAVEQATEFGATSIHFLRTDRVVNKKTNIERLQKIVKAASKQCGRANFLSLKAPVDFKKFIAELDTEKYETICCHWIGKQRITSMAKGSTKPILILIGPEGDFSPTELDLLKKKSISFVTLGERRLRAESALSTALAVVNETMLGVTP